MLKKTNVMRILDKNKISYKVFTYEVDENSLDAMSVALKINRPVEQVFKTLVLRGDRTGVLMTCIHGNAIINLKKLAKVSGNKNIKMLHLKEVQPFTGYIRGGVSPIGTKKNYPLYLDKSCKDWNDIIISAGLRGYQVMLSFEDIIKVHGNATVAEIC